jgi:urease accessory protein
MAWHGRLQLNYRLDAGCTTAHDRHEGPLRVLQRLYPEGPAICHHVLVHPPGGIVGGDTLAVEAALAAGAHALITTPGAARFYRSAGETAVQSVHARLAAGARLEWLPLETLAYDGCLGENRLRFELAPGAEMIGWDCLALGLPAADAAFAHGSFLQQLELPGVWLERGRIDAGDRLLRESALGWAGRSVLATLWFAAGAEIESARREALLEAARATCAAADSAVVAGITAPNPQLLVLRALGHRVEPLMQLLVATRAVWREAAWSLTGAPPRIWRT